MRRTPNSVRVSSDNDARGTTASAVGRLRSQRNAMVPNETAAAAATIRREPVMVAGACGRPPIVNGDPNANRSSKLPCALCARLIFKGKDNDGSHRADFSRERPEKENASGVDVLEQTPGTNVVADWRLADMLKLRNH